MKFPCRICSIELKNQKMLKNHFELCHPQNFQFQCPTCLIEFDNLSEIVDHMGTHIKNINQCSLCLQIFLSKKDLHNHYVTEHPGVDRSVCFICNKKYSDAGALAKHIMVHTGERPFYCPFCFMTFGLKCSQVVHIRRHTNYRPYKCQYCPKRFFNAGEIRKHLRLHTGEKPYKCTICKTAYTMRETLTNHLKTHKKFHMKCHYCPLSFNDQTVLETHMSTHSGVKPFKCPLCSVTNFYLGSLRRHVISIHVDNLNTNCQICGQFEDGAFRLAEHILTHRTDYIRTKTEWFDHVQKATKSHLSSRKNIVIQRKRLTKEGHKRPKKYSDAIDCIVTDESYQSGMVEEPKLEFENNGTCKSGTVSDKSVSGSQTNHVKNKGVREKKCKSNKPTSSKKHNKGGFNNVVDNFDTSTEDCEGELNNFSTFSCGTLKSEDINAYKITDIKEEYDEEQHEDIQEEVDEQYIEIPKEEYDDEGQSEGTNEDDEEENKGIQEVDVPEFKFLPQKKEFECSMCPEFFMSQEELLQHVSVHI